MGNFRVTAITLFLFSDVALGQTPIPATGLCNTGLTPASPLPLGCTTSVPVTPVNPDTGGPSVDGNWQLATPYPSAAYTAEAPDPCSLSFGSAWVDAPEADWIPNDSVSQFIMPENVTSVGGWFVYRTAIPIPNIQSNAAYYILKVAGRILVDDNAIAIFLQDGGPRPASCTAIALPPPVTSGWQAWNPIQFSTSVTPGTTAYLYFVDFNSGGDSPNPTALRLEFTSAYFIPK